jgi:ubiquinone/menaquinone biosynthesis C-methylase UbiE
MRNLHHRYSSGELDHNYTIRDLRKITELLDDLHLHEVHLNVLFENSLEILELYISQIDVKNRVFIVDAPSDLHSKGFEESIGVYASFYLNGGSHYFKCFLVEALDHRWVFSNPEVIFQSEKRSYQRKVLTIGSDVEVFLDAAQSTQRKLSGKLVDISRRGFLCEVSPRAGLEVELKKGQPLNYSVEVGLGLDSHGVVRHLKHVTNGDGSRTIRIGIEAGVQRRGFRFHYYSPDEWAQKLQPSSTDWEFKPKTSKSLPVRYQNGKGQEIVALINATNFKIKAPVVVLPPAFGKKKEALYPLVATLIENFRYQEKEIVTVRYDGINRPGESHNDEKNPKRGYEMLRYRLGQGQEDLRTTLDFVHDNPYFSAEQVIVITFSMSALDARRLLSSRDHHYVDYWISCMGVPAAQSAYGNILGGMDILGNYKLNIPNGFGGVLGHILDLDTLAKDLITQKSAYITDSRLDMSRIPIPVLWIYGTYDRWLVSEEVKDIMSVKAPAEREVIEIPTGHNLRCSDDAINTFKLISARLFEHLHKNSITPVAPNKQEMLRIISYERERVTSSVRTFRPEDYWKEYLIGQGTNSSGYDFYSRFEEFKKFLELEVDLIEPDPGDRIVDMGCGTGLFLESLLKRLCAQSSDLSGTGIVAVDIVQEALEKARGKYDGLSQQYPQLRFLNMHFRTVNLEPNRLIPVYEFINNPNLDYDFLRNRIQGLRNVTIDFLITHSCDELTAFMRGKKIDSSVLGALDAGFLDGHRSEIFDFNRAARFLLKRLESTDIGSIGENRSIDLTSPSAYAGLSASDLHFETLSFGQSKLELSNSFESQSFTKIVASLLISYLFNPELALREFYAMLKPGGKILVSSMKPDSDISPMYTKFIGDVIKGLGNQDDSGRKDQDLQAARAMLNEAASLFTLEEEGYFRFYSSDDLTDLLSAAGFENIHVHPSMGSPPQALIATGSRPK